MIAAADTDPRDKVLLPRYLVGDKRAIRLTIALVFEQLKFALC